jgi:hypothetical protein
VRLDRLLSAHLAVGGSGAGRRWATEELNHAILLRLASEFQGFCRDLYDEAVESLVHAASPGDIDLRRTLAVPFVAARRLDRGNAEPGTLGNDFGLLGIPLWPELKARYPSKGEQWRRKLELLNEARNGIVHDDTGKLEKVHAAGWSTTLSDIRRWRSGLDGLAAAMDHVIGHHLCRLLKVTPW